MIDRQTREEMKALSLEVFGSSSRWQKLLNSGYAKLVTEEVEETVPADETSTENKEPRVIKVQKPVLTASGAKQSVQTYYTLESLKTMMLELKDKKDAFLKMIKEQQEAKKAAEEQAKLQEKVQAEVAGAAGV